MRVASLAHTRCVLLRHPAPAHTRRVAGAPRLVGTQQLAARTRRVTAMAAPPASGAWAGDSEAALRSWLEAHGVRTAAWGTGTSKSVADLLGEVAAGETMLLLHEGVATRQLRIVQLRVRDPRGRTLVEASQVLPDGRRRQRDVLVSEKMLAGEAWRDAALRAVAEELGSVLGDALYVALAEETYTVRPVRRDSPSYPGLATQYEVHSVAARVDGLPQEGDGFTTREPRPPAGELVTHWEWREQPPPEF